MIEKESMEDENELWEDGFFAETVSPEEAKEREKTIHKKHDEDINYNCKECNQKISAHNRDWHAGMCDGCFDKMLEEK